jgi:hypothetical protein
MPRPSKDSIEQVNITRMNAIAVVHHREVVYALGEKAMDREHHAYGVQRMNQVGDGAIRQLPDVDLPGFVPFV